MPQSKSRPHQHHQVPHQAPKKSYRIVIVTTLFFALSGFGIAYFIAGANATWLIGGLIAGAVLGYVAGMQIEKALYKK